MGFYYFFEERLIIMPKKSLSALILVILMIVVITGACKHSGSTEQAREPSGLSGESAHGIDITGNSDIGGGSSGQGVTPVPGDTYDKSPFPGDLSGFPGLTELPPTVPSTPAEREKPLPYVRTATLMAVGDIMMHSPQIPAGYDPETKTYSYHSFFSEVKGILSKGDWVIGNLETPIAGEELGYSGYPQFNAPPELADALKEAGFNILTTANNHSLDRREQGVLRTLDNIRARGLHPVGTAKSVKEAEEILVVDKNGISIAVLSYTYGTNGIPIPQGKPYLVNLIDEAKIIDDIHRARDKKVDLVTVALHFGHEYHRQPSEQQKKLAKSLIAAGADIILGSHPHVVQPYERIEVLQEDGTVRQGVVIYSLGNFISNQSPETNTPKWTDVGVIFVVRINKHYPEERVEFDGIETIPTWVHRHWTNSKRGYRVLPIESVVTSKDDPLLTEGAYKKLEGYLQDMKVHVESMMAPPVPVSSEE
jgi:poly-gamma-glutamate capsule biosynthesis protein CapA/YwtB (metallophosphatase superfamily)